LTDAEQILFGVAKDNGARFSQIQEFETFCKLISLIIATGRITSFLLVAV
jgi:hypothetical protein